MSGAGDLANWSRIAQHLGRAHKVEHGIDADVNDAGPEETDPGHATERGQPARAAVAPSAP